LAGQGRQQPTSGLGFINKDQVFFPFCLPFMSSSHHDELTSTVFGAIQQLNQQRKATFLLDTALDLIDAGQ
jgi:hypothetical protein